MYCRSRRRNYLIKWHANQNEIFAINTIHSFLNFSAAARMYFNCFSLEYLPYLEKIIVPAFNYVISDKELKSKIQSKMKTRTVEDVKVLQTMLERCLQSSNKQLQMDLQKHGIPERIKKIAQTVTETHDHNWPGGKKNITLFECIQDEHNWNSLSNKTKLNFGSLAFAGALHYPTVNRQEYVQTLLQYQNAHSEINKHANKVEEKLSGLVEDIETLYTQTQALMIANCLK